MRSLNLLRIIGIKIEKKDNKPTARVLTNEAGNRSKEAFMPL